jgi:hypothetical protein
MIEVIGVFRRSLLKIFRGEFFYGVNNCVLEGIFVFLFDRKSGIPQLFFGSLELFFECVENLNSKGNRGTLETITSVIYIFG